MKRDKLRALTEGLFYFVGFCSLVVEIAFVFSFFLGLIPPELLI